MLGAVTAILQRVRDLIAKAVDGAVTEEEARSCALIAVRLIAENKLLVEPTPVSAPAPQPARSIWDPPPPRPRAAPQPRKTHWWQQLPRELWITRDYACSVCGGACEEGSKVWAVRLEEGALSRNPVVCHLECRDYRPGYCWRCGLLIAGTAYVVQVADSSPRERRFHLDCLLADQADSDYSRGGGSPGR